MSAKGIRARQWDDRHLVGPLTPLKYLIRALSSITLAVCLLVLVAVYGVLASVSIGLVVLFLTWGVYALSLAVCLAVVGVLPAVLVARALRPRSLAAAFAASLGVLLVGGGLATVGWYRLIWPLLQYNALAPEGTWRGVRFFPGFVENYINTPLREIPGMEMSELEFYGWWPLSAILLLFVANMVITTLRRIEFRFENLGVLTVHTGIVTIALGSVYYSGAKREGDMMLLAGTTDPATGEMAPGGGPPEWTFYDNTRVVLAVEQGRQWEERPLKGLPRYHAYNLDAVASAGDPDANAAALEREKANARLPVLERDYGPLRLSAEAPPPRRGTATPAVDADIRVEVVGYAPYAALREGWAAEPVRAGETPHPVRTIRMMEMGPEGERAVETIGFTPTVPAERVQRRGDGVLVMQYTFGASAERWRALSAPLPEKVQAGLLLEIPALRISRVLPITEMNAPLVIDEPSMPEVITLVPLGLSREPPLRVITPGFEGSSSSVAVVRVTRTQRAVNTGLPGVAAPEARPAASTTFTRYIYSLYPELDQDLSETRNAQGMPVRSATDASIRIALIDASVISVLLDEQRGEGVQSGAAATPRQVRAIVRVPGEPVRVVDDVRPDALLALGPKAGLRLGGAFENAHSVAVPQAIPLEQRDKNLVGNHRRAALAVKVSLPSGWSQTQWVPFVEYFGLATRNAAAVTLPDGRSVRIGFARMTHTLPGMFMQLRGFEMTPYPHSLQPQDFRSDVLVVRGPEAWKVLGEGQRGGVGGLARAIESAERSGRIDVVRGSTSLNEPLLLGPYEWSERENIISNVLGWIYDRLGPSRYKFAQAGWDNTSWKESNAAIQRDKAMGARPFATPEDKERAKAAANRRPTVQFTILGVGNNPGIYVVALGAILMGLGTPWAFYVKPALVRRKKRKIQAELAAGGGKWKKSAG
ncbi:hypothetical protein BH11PLA1_BH11PLA1_23850 [soil metagenome]